MMFGAFQQFFEHRTLTHEDIWKHRAVVLGEYAAVNEFIRPSLLEFFMQVAEGDPVAQSVGIRHVISLRDIVHHKPGCPVACSCRALGPSGLWDRFWYIHAKYCWSNGETNEKFFEETGNEEMPGSRRPRQMVKGRKWNQYQDKEGKRWWHNSTTEEYFFEDETSPVVSGNGGVWTRSRYDHVEYWWSNRETGDHCFE